MKRLFHTLLMVTSMIALVASCAKEPEGGGVADPALGGTPVPVTFNLDLGFALSKADTPVSTALDDGTAVNKVFAAVFSSDGSLISTSKIGGTGYDATASMSGGKASITITLAKGQDYKVVFFVQKDDTYQLEFADGNRAVFSYRTPVKANDPSQDAFWAVVDVKSTVASYNVTLKRPFAQLNVLVPADGVPEGKTTFSSTLSVLAVPTSFDLFAGQPGTDIADLTFTEQAISAPAFGKYAAVDGVAAYQWVGMNFLLVPASGKVSLSFQEKDMAEPLVLSGIPVKANGRTNLVGALYGTGEVDLSLNVQIDSGIGGGNEQKTDAEETEIKIADGSTYTTDNPLVIDATGAPLMKVRLSVNGHSFSEVLAGANGGVITASSADPSVAKANVEDEEVVITPVGNGETVVTVTTPAYTKTDYQGGSFKIPVKVTGVEVKKKTPVISVTDPADGKLSLEVGGTFAIKAAVLDGQEVVEGIAIAFASSDEEVATVDKDGLVKAVKASEATITLTTEENAGYNAAEPVTIAVTVTEPEPEEPVEATLTVTPESLSLEVGATGTITAVTNSSATPTFASDNGAVATVDAKGKVMAIAEGRATITVNVAAVEGQFTTASKTVPVTVTKAGQGEETGDSKATLTNAEIVAALRAGQSSSAGYGNVDIASASGTWTGNMNAQNTLTYIQIRNKKGAHITSPVFSSAISKVEITMTSDGSVSLADRTLHAVPPETVLPTGQDSSGKDIVYSSTEWANEYGSVRTGAEKGAKVTIDFAKGSAAKQFKLIVEGGATYIHEITVYFSGAVVSNPVVTSGDASSVSTASATLSGSFSGMTDVRDYGFYWGTSSTALTNQTHLNSSANSEESFSSSISSLEASTTYYYQAYVQVLEGGQLKEYTGEVKTFTTASSAGQEGYRPYLSGYEIPAIALKGGTTYGSGSEKSGCGYKWYNHETSNENQMVATHTYKYNNKVYRNYTCLVDKTKKAPLWSAFVMHKDAYPDNGVGRTGSWTDDPAIPSGWQQGGVDSPYSRGHFVASNYRQANGDANKATFYHTNQAPQYQTGFNDGVWNSLETAVVSNAPSGRDTLYVVVGVLYEDTKTSNGVPVPSHYYKLLMKCSFDTSGSMTAAKGVAYLYSNEAHKNENYNDSKFRTTIDAIEERAGFNFFVNIPPNLQDEAENKSASLW